MMKKRYFFFLILLNVCIQLQAWEMVAKPFPFFYDLYSNEIYDVYQDREGLIWIGTTSSVSFYDGFRLQTFRADLETSERLTNNKVRFIADSQTHVWITTEGGITLYNKETAVMHPIADKHLSECFIDDIKTDGTDKIWIAASKRVYLSNADGTIIKEHNPFEGRSEFGINSLYVDKEHNLWVLTKGGCIFKKSPQNETFEIFPTFPFGSDALTMYQDNEGRYWIGTWGLGLWQFMPNASEEKDVYIRHAIRNEVGETEKYVYGIVQDDYLGYLWVLGYNKMYALKYQCNHGLEEVDISHIIDSHKMFTRIMKDRQGNLWVGSYDEGYTIYFDGSGVQNYPLREMKEKLGWDVNLVNLSAKENYLWLSQDRYGGLLYDLRSGKLSELTDEHIGEISYMASSHTDKRIWVGSRSGGRIYELKYNPDGAIESTCIFTISNDAVIIDLKEDAYGNLWILTTTNLFSLYNLAGEWHYAETPVEEPKAMTVDDIGNIWCLLGNSLYAFSYVNNKIERFKEVEIHSLPKNETITAMTADGVKHIWMVSSLDRIIRYSIPKKTQECMALDSLLVDGKVQALLGVENNVWIMTNKKLLCYDVYKDNTMIYAADDDNVCVRAFRGEALCADGKGGVYAGGHNGFIHVNKDLNVDINITPFVPIVTDVIVNGRSLFYTGERALHPTFRKVDLQSSSRNVEIHLSRNEYALGKVCLLQFRLRGVEEDWNDFQETRPYAFYHTLPKGEHVFEIRMMQRDGTWGSPQKLMTITRLPAWYETNIAYAFYLFVLLLFLFLLCWRLRKKSEKKLQKELLKAKMNYLTADHKLMTDMLQVIDRHIDNAEFDLDKLAEEMNMSKSTLHRKVKQSMDMTPLDFVRNVRLKRACEMLEIGENTVSEIAYAIGFSNPKYFTKCFKQEFGVPPTEFAQNKGKQ